MELAFISLLALLCIFCTSLVSAQFIVEGADSLFRLESPIAALDVSTDVNRGWTLDPEWFPYVNKSGDVAVFRNSKPYFHTDFTDWDKIDQNPEGIWALLYQDPPPHPWNDELPFISYHREQQLDLRSVSISYYIYGNVSYSISITIPDVLIKEDTFACSGEPCGFGFEELRFQLVENHELGVGGFKLEFNITDDQSFVLIDKILVNDPIVDPLPTTYQPSSTSTERTTVKHDTGNETNIIQGKDLKIHFEGDFILHVENNF